MAFIQFFIVFLLPQVSRYMAGVSIPEFGGFGYEQT